jgi:purine-cytosine permease-like protein
VADSLFPVLEHRAAGYRPLIAVMVLNMYGGSLTLISSIDSLRKVRPTLAVRIVTVAITAAIS